MKYTEKDIRLMIASAPDTICKVVCRSRKRAICGILDSTGPVTAINLHHGCPAVRVLTFCRRHGNWHRAQHNFIIPLFEIVTIQPLEKI